MQGSAKQREDQGSANNHDVPKKYSYHKPFHHLGEKGGYKKNNPLGGERGKQLEGKGGELS